MSPEISVIVPVYNGARFYKRCFGSLLRQEFRDFEVIAVDDCSGDGSAELLERFWPKDAPALRILRNERNMGPSASRNRGIEAARGEWIGFVDHDDAVLPNYLSGLRELAVRNEADWVCCGATAVLEDGTREIFGANDLDTPGGLPALARVYQFHFTLSTWGSLLRREIVMEHGIRFTEGAFEDVFFHFRVLAWCRHAISVMDRLYEFHVSGGSLSHDMKKEDYNYLESFSTILPMLEGFLSDGREKLGMTEGDVLEARKFFLRLALLRLKTSEAQMGGEPFHRGLRERLEHRFGKSAAVYLETFAALYKDLRQENDNLIGNPGALNNKVMEFNEEMRKMAAELKRLKKRLDIYEAAVPELSVLYRKRQMINAFLGFEGKHLALLPEQKWYGEYWDLTAKSFDAPGFCAEEGRMKEEILSRMKGEEDPLRRQLCALALLLVATRKEAAGYLETSLWPKGLREDYGTLAAWEKLRGKD